MRINRISNERAFFSVRVFLFVALITLGLVSLNFSLASNQSKISQQQAIPLNDSIFNFYFEQHLAYLKTDSLELADSAIRMAVEWASLRGDISLLMYGLEKKAEFEFGNLLFRQAIETDHKRIRISSEANNTGEEAAAIRHIRAVYEHLSIVDSAIYYCNLEIDLNRMNKDYSLLCKSYLDMHSFLRWTLGGNSENTYLLENLLDSTLQAAYDSQNRRLIADMLITYGTFLYHQDYDAGLAFINQGIDSVRNDESLVTTLSFGLLQRGIVYFDSNQFVLAEADFLENIYLIQDIELPIVKSGTYLQLGRVYLQQGKFENALKQVRTAYHYAQLSGGGDLAGIYTQLAALFQETHQKDSTIFYLRKHVNKLYEQFNKNSSQQIAISGARFQISEHKSRIAALNYQNKQKELKSSFQRKFILLLSISLILVFILVFILNKQYRLTKKAYKKIQNKNAQLVKQEKQIAELREQKLIELTGRLEETLSSLEMLMSNEELFLNPDISLSSIAKLLKINSTYLSSLINQSCGCNFTQYINKYRIKRAVKLLDEGMLDRYSIDAISKMVGYKSKSAFYRAFRQQKFLTPTEYLSESKG